MCQTSGVTYSTVANPPDVPNDARTHGWGGWLPYRPGRHPSVSSRGAFLRAAPGQRAPPPACPARPGCSGARGGAGCSRPRQETEAEGHRHQHRHLRRRPERTHARAPRLLYALRRPARATPRPPESRPRSSALQWAFPVLAPRRPGLVWYPGPFPGPARPGGLNSHRLPASARSDGGEPRAALAPPLVGVRPYKMGIPVGSTSP